MFYRILQNTVSFGSEIYRKYTERLLYSLSLYWVVQNTIHNVQSTTYLAICNWCLWRSNVSGLSHVLMCNLTALFRLKRLYSPSVCENRISRTNLKNAYSLRFRLMLLDHKINMFKGWLLSEGFRAANCKIYTYIAEWYYGPNNIFTL
jgi:hypothetical protein